VEFPYRKGGGSAVQITLVTDNIPTQPTQIIPIVPPHPKIAINFIKARKLVFAKTLQLFKESYGTNTNVERWKT